MKYLYIITLVLLGNIAFSQEKTYTITVSQIKQSLSNVPTENSVNGQNIGENSQLPVVAFPLPDGTTKSFRVVESPVWEDAAAMKKADIVTYSGSSIDNDGYTVRFTISGKSLSGIIRTPLTYYIIEPVDATRDTYSVYQMNEKGTGTCDVNDAHPLGSALKSELNANNNLILSSSPFPKGTQLRVFRMAAAATGEFTASFSSQTDALNKITALVNLINAVYEAEAAMRFSLITETTNLTLIFTNAGTDPFTVDPTFASAQNAQAGFDLMAATTGSFANLLPYSQYDVGHVFNIKTGTYIGASGQAGPTPCVDSQKSRGWTEMTLTAANSYLGLVAGVAIHEIAHQFSVSHSYNAVGGGSPTSTFCTSGWASTGAVEPGAGSTLMGYNSNCQYPDYTLNDYYLSDDYFHTKSLEQIFVGTGYNSVNGTSCGYFVSLTNNVPVANAGNDFIIPKGTPFTLTGSATDADNDPLTYQWDQFDVATAADKGAFGNGIEGSGGFSAVNSPYAAPLFRSKLQTTPVRTFPALNLILQDVSSPAVSPNPADNEGEDLPQVARIMKFRLTVKDNKVNGGGVDSDEMIVTVNKNGPFLVTSQNDPTTWTSGGTATVTWSVNNTDIAPINCSNVKISLSMDGGLTYPTVLVASTANDGSEVVSVPATLTTTGRIKVEAVGNIFFDINNANLTITSAVCPPPSIVSGSSCGAGAVTLAASGCAGTINWYAASTGGSPLGTGTTFTTPGLTTTTNYYADCTNGGCTSSRRQATATINHPPAAPTCNGTNVCGTSGINLIASGCSATTSWYDTPTGGTPLATGGVFTTPTLTSSTTYYVDCSTNGCASSPRVSVPVTVLTAVTAACSPTINQGLSPYFGIANFTFTGINTINFSSSSSSGDGANYVDNSCNQRVRAQVNGTYSLSVAAQTTISQYARVYIDYNNDGDFTDAGEQVLSGYTSGSSGGNVLSGSITIPSTAVQSVPLRMRVLADFVSSSNSCLLNGYSGFGAGQIEDYALTIVPPCPTTLTLESTADDISSGDITLQASATVAVAPPDANIMASNKITGVGTRATYQARAILLNPGFLADTNTVFLAETGGCY